MFGGLDDLLELLEDSEFEETPVDLEEFVTSKDYLGLPPLSEEQYRLVSSSTQIYKKDTLIRLYGEDEGYRRFKNTVFEVIAQWGKGSGKDYCSAISVARVVYLLLCLKDPAGYYGKSEGDSIDILNVAINSDQAKNVFFKNFKRIIEKSSWFEGKYTPTAQAIEFDKNITCYSGHSQRESWEGYNMFMVILDEIAGFAMENTTGHVAAATAQAIYDMYQGSVISRFPEFGKLVLLSFPRYKDDFIQKRYKEAVANVVTTKKSITLKVDVDLPDGTEGNEFTIEWDYDEVVAYNEPRVYAIKRATWEVNPTWKLQDAMPLFLKDPVDALSRFACMPPEAIDAFFKSREKIETAFSKADIAHDSQGRFQQRFQPDPDKTYFVHVDLAYKHDHCAVAMAHVERWERISMGNSYTEPGPVVVVDCVKYWTPRTDANVNFDDVRNYILNLRRRGFNIKLVTFDRWNSVDSIKMLNDSGMKADRLSVNKKHYDDLALLVQEERIKGPEIKLLIDELLELRIMKGEKIDHPRKGSKDLADAVAGAVFNAVANTNKERNTVIEVKYLEPGMGTQTNKIDEPELEPAGVIRPPGVKRTPPGEIQQFLDRMRVL
jgi:hypothetical protein